MQTRGFEFSLEEIAPVAKKPGGTRFGYVGVNEKMNRPYLVKEEAEGYAVDLIGVPGEVPGVESFTAQLIRDIWGQSFATDIGFARINPQTKTKQVLHDQDALCKEYSLIPLTEDTITIPQKNDWAVVVPFEHTRSFTTDDFGVYNARLNQLQTIARLIGMGDYKQENFLLDTEGNLKLIDCSANFNWKKIGNSESFLDFFNKLFKISEGNVTLHSVDTKQIQATLDKFAIYSEEKLKALLSNYNNILSQGTQSHILYSVLNLQRLVKMFLYIQKLPFPPEAKQELMKIYIESTQTLEKMEMAQKRGEQIDDEAKKSYLGIVDIFEKRKSDTLDHDWHELSKTQNLKKEEFERYLHRLHDALPEDWHRFILFSYNKFEPEGAERKNKTIKEHLSDAIHSIKNNLDILTLPQALFNLREALENALTALKQSKETETKGSKFKANTLFKSLPFMQDPSVKKIKSFIDKKLPLTTNIPRKSLDKY